MIALANMDQPVLSEPRHGFRRWGSMPRYFFNTEDGVPHVDLEGAELPDVTHAQHDAVTLFADILKLNPVEFLKDGRLHLSMTDEHGVVLLEMTLNAEQPPAATS